MERLVRPAEPWLPLPHARDLAFRFSEHVTGGLWNLIPVHEALLRRTAAIILCAPKELFIRTADAVHLATAHEAGESEVWTSDSHLLSAAIHFGLIGRSV
jgi:predicted nucleic acid-binding protein